MNYIIVSIWHKLILICSLIIGIHGYSTNIVSLVELNNSTDQPLNISSYPENEGNLIEIDKNIDFIIKLQFILNEQKIMPFLRDEIYNDHEQHNITTKDIIDLWKLRDYALRDLIRIIGIPDALLNLNNFRQILDMANLTFNQYYAEIKRNVSKTQLRETFDILKIDIADFSSSITFGTEDEIYEVLGEGLYTWETLAEVKNKTGLDIPELTKNLILNQILSKNIQELVADAQKFPMANKRMYEDIWDQMNISTYDIYRIDSLRRIVNNIHESLNQNITFGMAVNEHEIILHNNILYNLGRVRNIVNVYGESSTSHHIYDNLTLTKGLTGSTSSLWSNNSLSKKIEVMHRMVNVPSWNCSYIDIDSTEKNVTMINITQTSVIVAADNAQFNTGNPLVCDGKLVGLAVINVTDENYFVFDTFFETVEELSNGSISLFVCSYALIFLTIVRIYFSVLNL